MFTFKGVIMQDWQLEFSDPESMYEEIVKLRNLAFSRKEVLQEAIEAIQSCELVEPNVKRIRLYEALGAIETLKSKAV